MTPRMVQNYHNAQRAFDILAKHEGAEQLLVYFRNRRAILAGIGRIPEKKYMIGAACSVVYHGLRGAAAHAEIRKFRYGDRWPDTNRLLRKIRKAVREYRNLYPYQSCDEFRRDVEGVFEDFKKYELKYYQEEK